MTNIVNPFSMSVLGATFPKPTLVNEVHVKYKAVMYRDLKEKVNFHLKFLLANNNLTEDT